MNDSLFSAVMFLSTVIVASCVITIALIVWSDAKLWSKLDRIVIFFKDERDSIKETIDDLKKRVEELKRN